MVDAVHIFGMNGIVFWTSVEILRGLRITTPVGANAGHRNQSARVWNSLEDVSKKIWHF